MQISIADFAKERQQERGTVNAFIRRNLEGVDGFIKGPNGVKMIEIDSEAYKRLDEQYPRYEGLEVLTAEKAEVERLTSELEETKAKYEKQLDMIAAYQQQTEQLQSKIGLYLAASEENNRLLLEAETKLQLAEEKGSRLEELEGKEQQYKVQEALLEERESQLQEKNAVITEQQTEIGKLQAQIQQQTEENQRLKNRTFWQRVFGTY